MALRTLILTLLCCAGASAAPATRPYKVAHESPLNPREQVVSKADAFTVSLVEFNGIEGDRVPAMLYTPNDQAKHPAVLLQYGSGGHKKVNYIVMLAELFARRGFVVITIDLPNRGDRKIKDPARARALENSQFASFLQTLGDYSRTIDYIAARPDVDPQRLTYVGVSWGAITGITYVAHDPRIKVMASLVGGGNFIGWLPGEVDPELKASLERFDPVYHVAAIAPRPLLLLNVTKDVLVPRFLSESLHKAAGEGAKKMWLETDHIFSTVDRVAVTNQVIDFVLENLAAGRKVEVRNPKDEASSKAK